jgi:hypothetical protein
MTKKNMKKIIIATSYLSTAMYSSRPLVTADLFLFVPFHRNYLHGFTHVNVAGSYPLSFSQLRHGKKVSAQTSTVCHLQAALRRFYAIKYSVFN